MDSQIKEPLHQRLCQRRKRKEKQSMQQRWDKERRCFKSYMQLKGLVTLQHSPTIKKASKKVLHTYFKPRMASPKVRNETKHVEKQHTEEQQQCVSRSLRALRSDDDDFLSGDLRSTRTRRNWVRFESSILCLRMSTFLHNSSECPNFCMRSLNGSVQVWFL